MDTTTCGRCGAQLPSGVHFCTQCGTSMSTPAPSVFAAPPAPPPVPPAGAYGEANQLPTEAPAAKSSSSRRTRTLALAGAGVLVLGGVGLVAVRSLTGADAGAESPRAAVEEMLASLTNEDPLGMAGIMAPSEARAGDEFISQLNDATEGRGELGTKLTENGVQLDPDDLIPGFTLSFSNVEYEIEEMHSDVAKVHITSLDGEWAFDSTEFASHIDIEQMSDGEMSQDELLDELRDDSGSFDESDLVPIEGEDPFVMAVKEGDGWFISPTFTALEYMRVAYDLPAPDFDTPRGNGADSPEQALENFVDAVTSADIGNIIESLPPDRYRAFYAYQDALEEYIGSGSGLEVNVSVDGVELFSDSRGQGVTVVDATMEWQLEGWDGTEYYTATVDGDCLDLTLEAPYDSDQESVCLDDFDAGPPFENGIPGIDRFWVIERQHDGKWYVDPVGTLGSWFAAIDTDQIADDLEDLADDINL